MAVTTTKAYTEVRPAPQPEHGSVLAVPIDIEFASTAYAANDIIRLVRLPAGVKCLDWKIIFPDLDTNGTPAFAFSLGIQNTAGTDLGSEVWATGLTAGQSTSLVRNTTNVAAQGDKSVDRVLVLKVTTAAATYAGSGAVGQIVLDLVG